MRSEAGLQERTIEKDASSFVLAGAAGFELVRETAMVVGVSPAKARTDANASA